MQHVSNYQIHEGFGDFYIQLGDSRALMMEAEEHRKHKHKRPVDPTNNMDCLSAGDDKKPDYYGKAMDELGRVGHRPCTLLRPHKTQYICNQIGSLIY